MERPEISVARCAEKVLEQVRTVVVGKDETLLWVLATVLSQCTRVYRVEGGKVTLLDRTETA